MGLAIDGNEVHGIARGGQAFISLGNTNGDGSLSIDGQDYLSKSKMNIKNTGKFNIKFGADSSGVAAGSIVNVTNQLLSYAGYLAICIIDDLDFTFSNAFIIPTVPMTEIDLAFDNSSWGGQLYRTTDSRFTFIPYCRHLDPYTTATGEFYILSNN